MFDINENSTIISTSYIYSMINIIVLKNGQGFYKNSNTY